MLRTGAPAGARYVLLTDAKLGPKLSAPDWGPTWGPNRGEVSAPGWGPNWGPNRREVSNLESGRRVFEPRPITVFTTAVATPHATLQCETLIAVLAQANETKWMTMEALTWLQILPRFVMGCRVLGPEARCKLCLGLHPSTLNTVGRVADVKDTERINEADQ